MIQKTKLIVEEFNGLCDFVDVTGDKPKEGYIHNRLVQNHKMGRPLPLSVEISDIKFV